MLLQSKEAYRHFFSTLPKDYQSFYKGQEPAKVLTLKEAQETISDTKEVYLSYILNDNFGYGIVITQDDTKLFEIKNAPKLLELSVSYRKLLEVPLTKQNHIEEYNTIASEVYTILFPSEIKDLIDQKKLIIISDYYLQNIPFEALISSNKNTYLIEEHDINYAYSISLLAKNKNNQHHNTNQFFGLAPVSFNTHMVDLPKSEYEIETISKLFSSTTFLREHATSANFFNHINDHNIIHLASHANANDSISPWIAYSDRRVPLNELYLSQNTADLVVLSACKTSLGKLNKGEGVMSLARSFFNTGSQSVLSSLWNVNDQSSSEIMIDFYKNLKDGKTKSEALRLSKLNYIKSHNLSDASPYYWASFVLIGDSEAIPSIQQSNNTSLLILGIAIALLCLYIVYKKLKSGTAKH